MELNSLYYFTELAKDLHVTRTAERLYISQQTLSNHIARLEEHYGAKLFYRKPIFSLTPEGEQVLAAAKVMLREESNLTDILADMEQQERGVLRFGASTLRLNSSLPFILPAFTARYPKVEIRLTDTISAKLTGPVLNGQLDLAVTVFQKPDHRLTVERLMDDQVYLCVSDDLLRKYYGEEAEQLKQKARRGALVADFARLPFCMLENRIGELVYECFAEAMVNPWAYITSTYTQISATICFQGLAAAFVPQVCLAGMRDFIPPDLNIFPMLWHGEPLVQPVSLIHLKERYLPRPFRYFRELLANHFRDVEQVNFTRIV